MQKKGSTNAGNAGQEFEMLRTKMSTTPQGDNDKEWVVVARQPKVLPEVDLGKFYKLCKKYVNYNNIGKSLPEERVRELMPLVNESLSEVASSTRLNKDTVRKGIAAFLNLIGKRIYSTSRVQEEARKSHGTSFFSSVQNCLQDGNTEDLLKSFRNLLSMIFEPDEQEREKLFESITAVLKQPFAQTLLQENGEYHKPIYVLLQKALEGPEDPSNESTAASSSSP
jgi:hypothetical protein